MLREEVEQYTKLTGEDGWHVPIMKVGAYLDGYNKGLDVLDKIKAEIEMYEADCRLQGGTDECEKCNSNVFGSVYRIIDKYKAESEE